MAAINWKTYDTGETVTEIRQNRRYKLASPSTVTGAPSLAMQSATQFAIVYIYVDDVKLSTPLTISGTTKTPITINGQTPSKEELLTLSIEIGGIGGGEVIYTTDEPNGSPSNPFTTVDQRTAWATANLSTLRPGVSTVWGPGAVEYVWNGPLATDWRILVDPPSPPRSGSVIHLLGDSTTWAGNGMLWGEQVVTLSNGNLIRGINAAVSGAKAVDLISQIAVAAEVPCDEAWIQIGVNNYGDAISSTISQIQNAVIKCYETFPGCKVRLFGIAPVNATQARIEFTYSFNAELQKAAADMGVFYAWGWEDCVNPQTGGLAAAYSQADGLPHPNLLAHNKCALARIAAIYGKAPTTISPILWAAADALTPTGKTMALSLLLADTDANGVPDTFNNYSVPAGSSAATLAYAAAPIIGKKATRTLTAHTGSIFDKTAGIPILANSHYEVSFYIKTEAQSATSGTQTQITSGAKSNYLWDYMGGGSFDIEGIFRAIVPKSWLDQDVLTMALNHFLLAGVYPHNMTRSLAMVCVRRRP